MKPTTDSTQNSLDVYKQLLKVSDRLKVQPGDSQDTIDSKRTQAQMYQYSVAKESMKSLHLFARPTSMPRPAGLPNDNLVLDAVFDVKKKGDKASIVSKSTAAELRMWRAVVMGIEGIAQSHVHFLLGMLGSLEALDTPEVAADIQKLRDFIQQEYIHIPTPCPTEQHAIELLCQMASRDSTEMSNELFYLSRTTFTPPPPTNIDWIK